MELLFHMGLMITLSAVFMYITHKLKQPILLGYILAGMVLGPFGLNIINDQAEIIAVGELGVAFLLFSAGIEIDIRNLISSGVKVIVTGIIQIILCFIFGYLLSQMLGFNQIISLHFGLLIAFSSTMIATKILVDKDETSSLHGRIIITLLILQDILAIIALLFIGNLSSININKINDVITNTEILVGIVIFLVLVMPKILEYSAKDKRLLYMTSLAVLFLMLGIVTYLGFSLGIGGFLAGFILANTMFKSNIRAEMKPLREFFAAIFFVSLGIQFNPVVLLHSAGLFSGLLILTSLIKPLMLIIAFVMLGYGLRNALLIGLLMGQSSEFSFILAKIGLSTGQFGQDTYSLIISTVVVSILITPYYATVSRKMYNIIKNRFRKWRSSFIRVVGHPANKPKHMKDHVIIVGAHRIGKSIIEHFKKKADVICVEHDPEILKELKKEGTYHIYGDITNEEILKELDIHKAAIIFLMIPDIDDQLFVVDNVKKNSKNTVIIGRAHDKYDALKLYAHGIDYVIVPEYVSSTNTVHMIDRILKNKKEWKKHREKHIKELKERMY